MRFNIVQCTKYDTGIPYLRLNYSFLYIPDRSFRGGFRQEADMKDVRKVAGDLIQKQSIRSFLKSWQMVQSCPRLIQQDSDPNGKPPKPPTP